MIPIAEIAVFDNPSDVLSWPITTVITALEFRTGAAPGGHVEFSKQDGPGRWPDVPFDGGSLQYTLGLIERVNDTWCASCAMQFWHGLPAQGGAVLDDNQIARNWYYDDRWGPLKGRQPAVGEHVGLLVAAGNLRGRLGPQHWPVTERAAVVEFLWPATYGPVSILWQEGDGPGPVPIPTPPPNLYGMLATECDLISASVARIARLLRLF